MFQPNSTMTTEEDINVDETTLNHVKEFTYLGSIITSDCHIEAELQKRMSTASMSFGRLRERLWNNHNVSIRVKGKIYTKQSNVRVAKQSPNSRQTVAKQSPNSRQTVAKQSPNTNESSTLSSQTSKSHLH